MARTSYTLDELTVGQTLTPENGFVTDLSMTTPPVNETPSFDEGKQKITAGYFAAGS